MLHPLKSRGSADGSRMLLPAAQTETPGPLLAARRLPSNLISEAHKMGKATHLCAESNTSRAKLKP